jgi:hypothetical protein
MFQRLQFTAILLLLAAQPVWGQVLISEFMASNTKTVADDFGQYEDWIEIYNATSTNVNLLNWALTDSARDLFQWRFPNTNLPPRTCLVVWASGRDRKNPGSPLHTNFKLGASGEYLALVRPDGSIATQFYPEFPPQLPDVSYGFGTVVSRWNLVTTGAVGRVTVPANDSLDSIWASTTFDDSGWSPVTNGIGFQTGASEFPTNVPGDVFADAPVGYWRLNEVVTNNGAVNSGSLGLAGNGTFKGAVAVGQTGPRPPAFPGFEPGNLAARFNGANATVDVAYSPALNPAGPLTVEAWVNPAATNLRQCVVASATFSGSARSGYVLYQSEQNVWEFRLGNASGYIATVTGGTVKTGAWHHVVGVYNGGSATLYVNGLPVATLGLSGAYQANTNTAYPFRIGATTSGTGTFFFNGHIDEVGFFNRALSAGEIAQRHEIAVASSSSYAAEIRTDVGGLMAGVNSSIYYRLPFVLTNAADIAGLTLRTKYDDGFSAFLNGAAAAAANAPAWLGWNSAATARRPTADALQDEEFDLTGHLSALRDGTNVLALQGLNLAANNPDFLLAAELEALSLGEHQAESRYFVQPTPGQINGGGTRDLGPIIAQAGHWPLIPGTNQSITVTCRVVQAFAPVASVTLHWRVMYGATAVASMFDDGLHGDGAAGDGVYGAIIPNKVGANWTYSAGQMVRWYFTAADTQGESSRWPLFEDPEGSAEYLGTVVQPNYVVSKLPVVHFFVSNYTAGVGVDNPNKTGGRASVYYDGEFYDNVFMKVRGNTTAGYLKKSHSVIFNREHPFRHPGPGGRVRKTSWTADYPDPTYMRQGLAFWLCEQMGAPGPFYYPMRLQMNGAFYQLANHNDLHDGELLERLGYDPDGALYNAAGTIVPSQFSTGGFDKKTRQWEGNADYTALANAISESLSVGQRHTNIFDRLDLPQVINYLAAARFVHENDDVWANMSLYHDNDGDDLWRIIPFDMNLSWGAAFMDLAAFDGIQVTNDNLKSFPLYGSSKAIPDGMSNWNRIYDVIFSVPQTREMFLRRMRTLLDTYVKPPGTPANQLVLEPLALAWRDLIGDEAELDRNTWGWPAKGGQCNFDPGIRVTNGVNILINEFIAKRRGHFYGKHSVTNVALPVGINKTDNAGIPLAQPTNAIVSILSWDYNPASGNQDHEYICLTNANAFAVDVSGWLLSGGATHRLQAGTVIPAFGALYLTPNIVAFRTRTNAPRSGMGLFVQGNYKGHLNAWGESLSLTDNHGRLVSTNGYLGAPSAAQRYLRITEIMYNPAAPAGSAADPQLFEYIELKNISAQLTLNLSGVRFVNGITFNFSGSAVTTLAPGQSVLVVRDLAAFTQRYGYGFSIAGQFSGALDNGGETLRLEDAVGEKILEFEYDDDWYPITDGLGFSLVIVDPNLPWSAWGGKSSWRPSGALHGSPGASDPSPPVMAPIRINEVLAHTDLPAVDAVELYNPTPTNVNISGWLLTDDFFTPAKYRMPEGTVIPANGYLTLDANQFGAGAAGFLFSEYGEQVYLFSADANTNLTGYAHGFAFSVSPNGVSFGRHVTSQGKEHFVLQSQVTLNASNAPPRVGPIVISEIMYHPPDYTNGADNALDEYIELQNITATNVPLYCIHTSEPGYGQAARTNTWRLRDAVDYDFPTNQVLAANSRLLVVGFNPTNTAQLAAFRTLYNVPTNVPIYGPWQGKLDNSSDSVELKCPDKPDVTSTNVIIPYFMVDEINYGDGPAWPLAADGLGNSLQRISLTAYGNDPTNWVASGSSAGRTNTINLPPAVAFTSPSDGATFNRQQPLTLTAAASDPDGSVVRVDFYSDGQLIGSDTAAPWSLSWTSPPYGKRKLTARATDNQGGISQSPPLGITITSQPPVLALQSPAEGAVIEAGSSVWISASASDADGTVVSVDCYANGSLIATLPAAPWTLNWLPAISGPVTLTAIARDDSGAESPAATRTLSVQAALVNPVLIPAGADWRFLDNGVDQGTAWMAPSFDDSSWPAAPAKFGFNNNNNSGITTVVSYGTNASNKYPTYYFRKLFVVPTLAGLTNLYLEVMRDDGVAVYLNGAPLYRDNLPAGTLAYTQLATNCSDNGTVFQTAILPTNGLVVGTNLLAAEVHQSALASSDLAFDLRLTLLGIVKGPAITGHPQSRVVLQGAPVTFAVTATGSSPLAYHWRFNGANINGATAASYTIPSAQPAHAGEYSVLVTNAAGSVVSLPATLTVTVPAPLLLTLASQGASLVLNWSGGQPPFQVQMTTNLLASPAWQNVGGSTSNRSLTITPGPGKAFYRVLGQD